jgi:hypothetical protein
VIELEESARTWRGFGHSQTSASTKLPDLEIHPQIHETRVIKEPSEQACGHRLRPRVKGKVKGAKGTRLNRFTV